MNSDHEPVWQKVAALIVGVAFVAALAAFRNRLGVDFWPLDRSTVGPNRVASGLTWAFVLIGTALIYPPVRRRIKRYADARFAGLHTRLRNDRLEARAHREWEAKHLAEMYEKHMGKKAEPHPHFGDVTR